MSATPLSTYGQYEIDRTTTGLMRAVQMLRKVRGSSSMPQATAAASRAVQLCLRLPVSLLCHIHRHNTSGIKGRLLSILQHDKESRRCSTSLAAAPHIENRAVPQP